jgi:tRNA G10  N-methylase Trm11
MKITHPAKFSDNLIPFFAEKLQSYSIVLDPMAGTGKIALIKDFGWKGFLVCNEIEPEYAQLHSYNTLVDQWYFSDAGNMQWAKDNMFDAIATSPTYGNRMADHWDRNDKSIRYSYTFCLGHDLHKENTGRFQWGDIYRQKHDQIWRECYRVLRPSGILLLNISNHIRKKHEIDVVSFHMQLLIKLGFKFMEQIPIGTRRLRNGANAQLRCLSEFLIIFKKQ